MWVESCEQVSAQRQPGFGCLRGCCCSALAAIAVAHSCGGEGEEGSKKTQKEGRWAAGHNISIRCRPPPALVIQASNYDFKWGRVVQYA